MEPHAQANGTANGVNGSGGHNTDKTVAAMRAMVEAYRDNWPRHHGTIPNPSKDTILVTGTTGSLGAGILAKLFADPKVEHIYALNRPAEDGTGLIERQKAKLRDWGFDERIVDDKKVTLIEAHMSRNNLGISEALYDKVSSFVCVLQLFMPIA